MKVINNKLLPLSRDECLHTLQLIHNLFYNNVTESQEYNMVYVLEVYSYQSNKTRSLMFSENLIKLQKFIDLTIEYHIDWNFCSRTFREFCVGRCSDDWLDDFESLFLTLSINLGNDCDWWNELGVSEIELDVIKYL